MENKINHNHIKNNLSILIRQDGFSFLNYKESLNREELLHFNLGENQSKTPENLLSLISQEIDKDFIEANAIENLHICYHHSLFGLCPTTYFDEKSASDIIKYNTKILPGDYLASDEIKEANLTITYIPFNNINNYFIDLVGTFDYQHLLESLIKINIELDQERERMLVYVEANCISLSVFQGKKLIMANSFNYQTQEDLAYYILFCIEQTKLDREEMILLIFGKLEKSNKAYGYLYNYIKHVDFLFSEIEYTFTEIQLKSFQLLFDKNYAHSLRKI